MEKREIVELIEAALGGDGHGRQYAKIGLFSLRLGRNGLGGYQAIFEKQPARQGIVQIPEGFGESPTTRERDCEWLIALYPFERRR